MFANTRWSWARIDITPDQLPRTVHLSPPKPLPFFLMAFGAVWLLMIAGFGAIVLAGEAPWFFAVFLVPFVAVGVGLEVMALWMLKRSAVVAFGTSGIHVTERSWRGESIEDTPYTAFTGVIHRQHIRRSKKRTHTTQIVELRHPDRSRSVPLVIRPGTSLPRAEWEAWARHLGLPAVTESPNGLVVSSRSVDELDVSLQDKARAGGLDPGWDPDSPPPPSVAVTTEGSGPTARLRLRLVQGRVPVRALGLVAVLPLLTVGAATLAQGDLTVLPVAFGPMLVAAGLWVLDRRKHREIIISRDAIEVVDTWAPGSRGQVPLKEVEEVLVVGVGLGRELQIVSDRRTLKTARGLPKADQDWLRGYVTAAIATA